MKLPASAEILMHEDEYYANPDDWKTLAGKAKVVPFPKGDKIQAAVKRRISKKGYKLTYGGDHGWYESDDLLYIEKFIRKSKFLSFDEQDRLIALAAKKGYQNWNQIFLAIAEKYRKMTLPHGKTVWREIEVFSEEVYGVIFEPHGDEEATPAKDMKHKLEALVAEADKHQEKVKKVIDEERFASLKEKASLNLLIKELNKVRNWVVQLLEKIESLPDDPSWKQFLQQERII